MQSSINFLGSLVLGLAFASGCGSDESDPVNPSSPDAANTDPSLGEPFSVSWGPLTVLPGLEETRCVTIRLTNENELRIKELTNVLGDVSHHYIVYRTNETEERLEPYPCQPFFDLASPDVAPLMVTQKETETLSLPEGVGLTFAPNQMIRLELHFINATETPKVAEPKTTFVPMTDEEFVHEADFLFMGDVDIDIAPMSSATVGPTYLGLPSELLGSKFFGMTGHTHQWGTNVTVAASNDGSQSDGMLYDIENWDWDEPDTVIFDSPLQIDQGGFRIECNFENKSASRVTFGESANQEMCFFWAYYYPSKGAQVCIQTDALGGFVGCCPSDHPVCGVLQ